MMSKSRLGDLMVQELTNSGLLVIVPAAGQRREHQYNPGSVVGVLSGIRQRAHHLIQAEAGWLLARRKLLEAAQPPSDVCLCGNQQIDAIEPPMRVVDALVFRPLEWISMQVHQLG